jgi:hypothetical protein
MNAQERERMMKVLEKVVAEHFQGFDSLEVRKLDRLDFHEVYVVSLVEGLEKMYQAGFSAGQKKQ